MTTSNISPCLEYCGDELLVKIEDSLLVHERQLHIDLRELRLPVCAQVFITEAPGYLKSASSVSDGAMQRLSTVLMPTDTCREQTVSRKQQFWSCRGNLIVTVKARYHKHLLEELRALREGVKLSCLQPVVEMISVPTKMRPIFDVNSRREDRLRNGDTSQLLNGVILPANSLAHTPGRDEIVAGTLWGRTIQNGGFDLYETHFVLQGTVWISSNFVILHVGAWRDRHVYGRVGG